MNREIEIRIILDDKTLEHANVWLEKNACFTGETLQVDYYLDNPENTSFYVTDWRGKDTDSYVRVRKAESKNYLCVKKICRGSKGGPVYADEYETVVENVGSTLGFMKAIGYTDVTIIKKNRRTYEYDVFEIAIDNVEPTGFFMEIELKQQVSSPDLGYKLIYDCLKKIGIKRFVLDEQGHVHKIWNPGLDLSREVQL